MIRTLIVEDEPLSRRALRQLIARHPDVEIVGECGDGVEAEAALETLELDLLLLDVRMPERSGLDVARSRGSGRSAPLVVFVTAFDQFAVPAFETEAVDYLTKPVTEERFDATLRRVREQLELRRLASGAELGARYVDRLVTRVRDRELLIPTDSVDYIAADDVYAAVHAAGRRHLVRVSLDMLETRLDPAAFLRVHRSYIVRLDRVTAVRALPGGRRALVLASGATVPVSRRRRATIDRALARRRAG